MKGTCKMEIGTCSITKEEVIQALERENTLTLATCAENRVTIRPMSHINDGMTILFQTGKDSLKMQQIRANPHVAVCVGTYEIEGRAHETGHPLAADNAFFARAYKEKHPGSFEKYSAYEDEVVVCVTVERVRQWRYVDGQPVMAEGVLYGQNQNTKCLAFEIDNDGVDGPGSYKAPG